MANKRMFNKKVIDSDIFLDMPQTTQNLYFHLNMRGDDDGFVDAPKKVMRSIGSNQNDLEILLAKRYLLAFESGVIVIKHWKLHNTIRKDRYNPTLYQEELKTLIEKDNGIYTESYKALEQNELEQWQPDGNQMATSGTRRLDQTSLDKGRVEKINKKKINKKESQPFTHYTGQSENKPTKTIFSEITNYWNEKVPDQATPFTSLNMSLSSEVVALLEQTDIEVIKTAIEHYGLAYEHNKYRVAGFSNFMTMKNIESWYPESSVENRKPDEVKEKEDEPVYEKGSIKWN